MYKIFIKIKSTLTLVLKKEMSLSENSLSELKVVYEKLKNMLP